MSGPDPHLNEDGSTSWGPEPDAACSDPLCSYRAEHRRIAELEAEIERLRSYTDEDVERVAEAIFQAMDDVTEAWVDVVRWGWTDVEECRRQARAALDAFLKGKA